MAKKQQKLQVGIYSFVIVGAVLTAFILFSWVILGTLIKIEPVASDAQVIYQASPTGLGGIAPRPSNLAVNGGFESASVGWHFVGPSESVGKDTVAYAGSKSMRLEKATAIKRNAYQDIPVVVGQSYQVSGYLKTANLTAGQKAQLVISWRRSIGSLPDVPLTTIATSASNSDWANLKTIVTAPQGATKMRVELELTKANSPLGVAWFDEISVIQYAPKITVISPNGGERLEAGKPHIMKWEMNDFPENALHYAHVVKANDLSYVATIGLQYHGGSSRGVSWTPSESFAGGQYLLKVFCSSTNINPIFRTCSDVSDAPFTVVSSGTPRPSITVVFPNGGEQLPAESMQNIQWISSGLGTSPVNIYWAYGDGNIYATKQSIVLDAPNTGSYPWKVPSGLRGLYLRIIIEAAEGDVLVQDMSDKFFGVGAPQLSDEGAAG